MNFVDSLNMFGVAAKEIPCIKGSGAPTTATVGGVGSLYIDTDTGTMYKCVEISAGSYVWTCADGTDKLKVTDLGGFGAKNGLECQDVISAWLDTVKSSARAVATFIAGANFADCWGDLMSTISGGMTWTVELVTEYAASNYAMVRFSTYTDKYIYYAARNNGVWGLLRKVSFEGHTHSANDITTGTMKGEVYMGGKFQTCANMLLRNSKLSATTEYPRFDGEICWQYE